MRGAYEDLDRSIVAGRSLERQQIDGELRALMADWLRAECSVIEERGGDMTYDLARLREDAVGRCQRLRLPYTNDLFPEWVRGEVAWADG
jgi:hypothetical protein